MDKPVMDNLEYAHEWLQFAENDLRSANNLMTHYPIHIEVVVYLCQQSAEKSLKGLLVVNNIQPPKTHNLSELLILCKGSGLNAGVIAKECNFLNQYSVTPRYPHEIAVSKSDPPIALDYAKTVLELVKALYPQDNGTRPLPQGTAS
ncbi:HEPN domain-containing protein [Breznakiellaceae bacterium SP9]